MSAVGRQDKMIAKARAMVGPFEQALEPGHDALVAMGFAGQDQRLTAAFASLPRLRPLAGYAGAEARSTARYAVRYGLPLLATASGVEARAALHFNTPSLLTATWMNNSGMQRLSDALLGEPDMLYALPVGTGPKRLLWDDRKVDIDLHINAGVTGCPAHALPLTDSLPTTAIEANYPIPAPASFLDQFFRLAIDTALAEVAG